MQPAREMFLLERRFLVELQVRHHRVARKAAGLKDDIFPEIVHARQMMLPILVLAVCLAAGSLLGLWLRPRPWAIYAGVCLCVLALHAATLFAAGLVDVAPSYSLADLLLMRRFPMGGALFYAAYLVGAGSLGGMLGSAFKRLLVRG